MSRTIRRPYVAVFAFVVSFFFHSHVSALIVKELFQVSLKLISSCAAEVGVERFVVLSGLWFHEK